MKTIQKQFFPFGSMYAPVARATEVPPSEWEKDVVQMKRLGLTMFRSWASWDRIERIEGVRDFSMLDRIFRIAERHGMKIMLNFGGFSSIAGVYHPEWLIKDYKCEVVRTEPETPGAGMDRRLICYDDPVFVEKAHDFMAEVVSRYSKSPALHCWLISSEACGNGCVCRHSLDKFRTWLRHKYRRIGNLNGAWSDEYPVSYKSWDEVRPIKFGYPCQLDWQQFSEDNLAAVLAGIDRLIKKHDPLKRTTTVNPNPYQLDSRSWFDKCSFWKTARVVDVLGISHYHLQYPHHGDRPYVPACYLDRVRSASKKNYFWIVETQAGPALWDLDSDSPYHVSEDEAIMRYWQMLGHGARAISSWLYRTRIKAKQAGEFGLVGWDGSPTDRAKRVGELSSLLQKNADMFLSYEYKAEIAILSSYSTLHQGILEGYENLEDKKYNQHSWLGAYKLIWGLKLQADFIDDSGILEGNLSKYKVLIAPFVPNISAGVAGRIREFVENGGRIIADFPFGFKDDDGTLHASAPGHGLDKVFGCSFADAVPVIGPPGPQIITVKTPGLVSPHLFVQHLRASAHGKVLSRFNDGRASLVHNKFRRGETYMFGTMLFADYEDSENDNILNLVGTILKKALPPRSIEICSLTGKNLADLKNIEICEQRKSGGIDGKDESLCYALNHGDEKIEVILKISGAFSCLNIFKPDGSNLVRKAETANRGIITLALAPKSAVIIKLGAPS